MADTMRVLIVDDEPLARERIRDLLEREQGIEVIGECADGRSAAETMQQLQPDLVFLDVQMPELDGFAALAEANLKQLPCIVFVTAFDDYALRAFEARAVDYVLKPFDRDRFHAALERARTMIAGRDRQDERHQLVALIRSLAAPAAADRILIKEKGRVQFLRTEQIDWVEAEGNYVRLHCGEQTHLIRETLTEVESRLSPNTFCRIHRGTIVNIDRIKELQPLFHGEYAVILQDGTRLTLSRTFRERLQERFGRWL